VGGVFYSEVKSPLGLYTYDGNVVVTPDGHWAAADYPVVIRTDTGSVAERAGLRPGDVVLTVNGRDARGGNAAWRLHPSETSYVLHVERGETEMDIVMERPGPAGVGAGASPEHHE
jgi:C-terminal processing protease CtpA/Prc